MKKGKNIVPFGVVLFAVSLLLTGSSAAGNTGPSDESQVCLSCHVQHGLLETFENNETLDAYVDPEQIKSSVHHSIPCLKCHPEFSGGKHPKETFRSKEQYHTRSALICRHCHRSEQLKANPIHAALFGEERKGIAAVCTNCHGSHAIRPVTGGKEFLSEEDYCLKCHGYTMQMAFRNGESHSATVNMTVLQASVHNKLSCSDCHYGFSSEEHPKRNFSTHRDYTIALSENCRRCHFDKYTKTLESIHFTVLSQGNQNAPVCTDCHGDHGISHIGKERTALARRCQGCHSEIYAVYAKSVHGSALFDENNQDVPVCTDCHTAHMMQNPLTRKFREQIPEMCSNCHANEAIMGKYGLSTAVVDNYLSDFHGVTLKFYRMQQETPDSQAKPMAVCTDCHGTHDISSTVGPNATVLKSNLVKQCQKCHAGAPKNFPDSWLSHYEPSFKRAPLVFLITLAYKIFIPVLAVGLILQILLHIWRYVANK
jgi:predicted CXXCH cytochrome family protein